MDLLTMLMSVFAWPPRIIPDNLHFESNVTTHGEIWTYTSSQFEVSSTARFSTEIHDVTSEAPYNSWNNADNVISFVTYQVIENVVQCQLMSGVYFIGAPLNVLNLAVFCKQGLRDRMNFCLFSLSLVDFLYTTTRFLFNAYCFMSEDTNPDMKEWLQWALRKHLGNFMFGFLYSSGCLTAIISVERCLCVVFPMRAATLVKTRTMVFLIVATVMALQFLCSIYTLKHQVTPVTDAVTGKTHLVWTDTDLYVEHKSLFDALDFVVLPTITLTNFFVVSIATAVTVVKLTQAMKWRQNTSSTAGDKRQMMLVKMLVTVSCIYITCTAPMVALAFARFVVTEFSTNGRYRNIFFASHAIGSLIMMVNSSVNFVVYVTQSSRFKKYLLSLFLCCKMPQASLSSDVTTIAVVSVKNGTVTSQPSLP